MSLMYKCIASRKEKKRKELQFIGTRHRRQSRWMHAPPAGVSVGTHITKVPLTSVLSNLPAHSSIQLSISPSVSQSIHSSIFYIVYHSIHPSSYFLMRQAAMMTSLLDDYVQSRLALPPRPGLCSTAVLT